MDYRGLSRLQNRHDPSYRVYGIMQIQWKIGTIFCVEDRQVSTFLECPIYQFLLYLVNAILKFHSSPIYQHDFQVLIIKCEAKEENKRWSTILISRQCSRPGFVRGNTQWKCDLVPAPATRLAHRSFDIHIPPFINRPS